MKNHKPNSEIRLKEQRFFLYDHNKKFIEDTELTPKIVFFPTFQIQFEGQTSASFNLLSFKEWFISTKKDQELKRVIIHSATVNLDSTSPFILSLSESPLICGSTNATKVEGYISNTSIHIDETFEFGNYNISVRPINTSSNVRQLESEQGIAVTHLVEIERSDKKEITHHEYLELASKLFNLFSFINGFYTPIIYASGFLRNREVGWEVFSNVRTSNFKSVLNWFDPVSNKINEISNGFFDFSNNQVYGDHINEIIYWYMDGCKNNEHDKSVILLHTALELFSWLYLTKESKALSKDGFGKLPTHDKISLTLSSHKIPLELPKTLTALSKLVKANNIPSENGPKIFSEIRNKIIHPSSKSRKQYTSGINLFESKLLALHYLELLILYKSGFNGKYFNVTDLPKILGKVEKVPWG